MLRVLFTLLLVASFAIVTGCAHDIDESPETSVELQAAESDDEPEVGAIYGALSLAVNQIKLKCGDSKFEKFKPPVKSAGKGKTKKAALLACYTHIEKNQLKRVTCDKSECIKPATCHPVVKLMTKKSKGCRFIKAVPAKPAKGAVKLAAKDADTDGTDQAKPTVKPDAKKGYWVCKCEARGMKASCTECDLDVIIDVDDKPKLDKKTVLKARSVKASKLKPLKAFISNQR